MKVKTLCGLVLLLPLGGCGSKEPPYNEAIQTYEYELELLDRLELERTAIRAKYAIERKESIPGVPNSDELNALLEKQYEDNIKEVNTRISEQSKYVGRAKIVVDNLRKKAED